MQFTLNFSMEKNLNFNTRMERKITLTFCMLTNLNFNTRTERKLTLNCTLNIFLTLKS